MQDTTYYSQPAAPGAEARDTSYSYRRSSLPAWAGATSGTLPKSPLLHAGTALEDWWQWCYRTYLPTDRSIGRSIDLQHSSQLLTECNQTTMAVPNPVKADNSQTGEAAAGRRRGRGCLVTHARSLGGAGATSVRAGLRRRRPGRFLPPQTTSSSHCWLIFFLVQRAVRSDARSPPPSLRSRSQPLPESE